MNIFNRVIKRIFDITASGLGIIVLSPILIVIALIIKKESDGPVFFKQIRVGEKGRNFEILKYRTMVVDAEKMGRQITVGNDNRITKIGGFLRKYKLDELPQLINVFKGDMSLVGPRPEVPRYVEMYNEENYQYWIYEMEGSSRMKMLRNDNKDRDMVELMKFYEL